MKIDPYAQNYSEQADATVQPFAGFTTPGENFSAELGFVIDEEISTSSVQDPESVYAEDPNLFNLWGVPEAISNIGQTQVNVRNKEIREKFEEGLVPQHIYDENTRRIPRAGNKTDWNAIIIQMREEMPDIDLGFQTEDEMFEDNKSLLADRRKYVEDIRARQTTGGWWAGLGGGMVGSVMDPAQSAAMILSAPAVGTMRLSRAMYAASVGWRTAALEMGIQIPTELFIHSWKEEIGSEYTWKDSAINLAASGVFAGTIGTAVGLGTYRIPGADKNTDILSNSTNKEEIQGVLEDAGVDADNADILSESIVEVNSAKVDAPEMSFKERAAADGFTTERNWYHANQGGIIGGEFDNARLPRQDPDTPFNAHWFDEQSNVSTGWSDQGRSDTITPVYLNLSKPATMKDLRRIAKTVTRPKTGDVPLGETYASKLRVAMADAGFTHMVWEGRGPIDHAVFDATGEVRFKDARGKEYMLKQTEETGTIDLYDPKLGVGINGHVTGGWKTLDEYELENPPIESIAMFDPMNIRVDVDHPDFKAMPIEELMTNIDRAETRINEAAYDEFDTHRTEKEKADDATAQRLLDEERDPGTKIHKSQASFRKDAKERGYVVKKLSKFEPDVVEDSLIALPNKNSQLSEAVGEYDIQVRHGEIREIKAEVPTEVGGVFEFETRQGVMDYANAKGLIVDHTGDGHLEVRTKDGLVVGEWNEDQILGFIDDVPNAPVEVDDIGVQAETGNQASDWAERMGSQDARLIVETGTETYGEVGTVTAVKDVDEPDMQSDVLGTLVLPEEAAKWVEETIAENPGVQITMESGKGESYGEAGDLTAHDGPDMQADVVDTYPMREPEPVEGIPEEIQGRKTVQNGKIVDEQAEYQALIDEQQRVMDIMTCLNGKSN